MKIFYFSIFLLFFSVADAQNFNGQWKGGFNESSYGFSGLGGGDIDYVLELETKGTKVSGYSYTYFREGAKRYYTICKLTGTLDKANKEIIVTEIERTKYNTPPNFQNCFQTHKLHYVQDSADIEMLKGTWMPAPNQSGNCGYGTTLLSRRIVKQLPMGLASRDEKVVKKPVTKKEVATTKKPTIKSKNPTTQRLNTEKIKPDLSKNEAINETTNNKTELKKPEISPNPVTGFKTRRKDIIKTIPITNESFKIDFYDNGEIDGDSISVFYNGRLVLSHQRLSDKPLSLKLALDSDTPENLVTMYAENLGTIPPNTALMIVTDGDKRYEVRITSDTEKSGSVVFVHKEQ